MNEEPEAQAEHGSPVLHTPLRRRSRRRSRVYARPVNKRALLSVLLLLFALLSAGAVYQRYHLAHYALELDGKPLVALASKQDAEDALRLLRAKYAPNAPGIIIFEEGEPTVARINPSMLASSPQAAAQILDNHLTVKVDGYAIFVNHIPLILLDSKESAALAISLMEQQGMDDKNGFPTIKQRVTCDPMHQTKEKIGTIPIMTPQQAAAELVHPPRKQFYTVKEGDSFWSIANAHGILVSDLDTLNPGMTHLLHVGDQVRLPDQLAPVTIVVRELK